MGRMPFMAGLLLLATLVVPQAWAGGATWSELSYPIGIEKHLVRSAPQVEIHSINEAGHINYGTLYRSGHTHGNTVAARNVDKTGGPVYEYSATWGPDAQREMVSNAPDFTSILNKDGKIYSITQFEWRNPGVAYLSELEQNATTGKLTVKRMKPLDFSAHGGVWTPCAGSVTPWQSHIGSEEYEPDAKAFYEAGAAGDVSMITWGALRDFMRYFNVYKQTVTRKDATDAGFYPYQYGYPWETKVKNFTETTTKLYAHGRMSYEMSYVMPDKKTVYGTDDGTNVMFHKFVATTAGDISEGVNYCAKITQTSADDCEAIDFTAKVEWLEMPTPTSAQVKAAIKTETFSSLFDSEECNADGSCPSDGYKATNTGKGCECLRPVIGKEALAATLEKRRYAGWLGCTTEFSKWEGITYDAANRKIYTAVSSVGRGMVNNDASWDKGTGNHIKVKENSCGCVMEMDVDDSLSTINARMLTCGTKNTDSAWDDKCSVDGIANPDNVAMIPDYNQLIIGEDTGGHQNDLIWIWDFNTKALTRVASTPYGSETTSPYWYTVGDWNYMSFVVQHPYGESDQDKHEETIKIDGEKKKKCTSGIEGHIGYVGPIMKKTPQPASIDMPEASEPSNNNAMTAEIVVWVFAAVLAVTVIGGLLYTGSSTTAAAAQQQATAQKLADADGVNMDSQAAITNQSGGANFGSPDEVFAEMGTNNSGAAGVGLV